MSTFLRDRGRALATAIFWATIGVASFVVGVQSSFGQRAEESALDAARFTTSPPAPLNLMSAPALLTVMALLGLVAWAVHGWRRAIGIIGASATAIVASQLLKLRVLERPQLLELDIDNTFPSGHMTAFTVCTAALVWAVPTVLRAYSALGGAALLSMVSWQLLAYGWHRPSDVLGGIALGVLTFAAAAVVQPLRVRRGAPFARGAGVVLIMSALLCLAVTAALLVIGAARETTELILAVGQLAAIGVSALGARSLLSLAERN